MGHTVLAGVLPMVKLPDRVVAQHAIALAREHPLEYDMPTKAYTGEYGQHEHELDVSVADLDPRDCDVDTIEIVADSEPNPHQWGSRRFDSPSEDGAGSAGGTSGNGGSDGADDDEGETVILVHGEIEASYSVKTRSATYNPPGQAHPAEYENRTQRILVTIEYYIERQHGLGEVRVRGERE